MVAEAGTTDTLVTDSFLRSILNNEPISGHNLLFVKVGSSKFCGRDFRGEELLNGREIRHSYVMELDACA